MEKENIKVQKFLEKKIENYNIKNRNINILKCHPDPDGHDYLYDYFIELLYSNFQNYISKNKIEIKNNKRNFNFILKIIKKKFNELEIEKWKKINSKN